VKAEQGTMARGSRQLWARTGAESVSAWLRDEREKHGEMSCTALAWCERMITTQLFNKIKANRRW
jgi:hypothetical protein